MRTHLLCLLFLAACKPVEAPAPPPHAVLMDMQVVDMAPHDAAMPPRPDLGAPAKVTPPAPKKRTTKTTKTTH